MYITRRRSVLPLPEKQPRYTKIATVYDLAPQSLEVDYDEPGPLLPLMVSERKAYDPAIDYEPDVEPQEVRDANLIAAQNDPGRMMVTVLMACIVSPVLIAALWWALT